MDIPNAFVGKKEKPTVAEISAALGPTGKVWQKLISGLAEEQGVTEQEWKSYSLKYGWTLQLKLKKRTIVHLSPCKGSFRVAFVLGDKAVKAARQSNLPKHVAEIIQKAPRYPEGTGVRMTVKSARELPAIRKLAAVKLAN